MTTTTTAPSITGFVRIGAPPIITESVVNRFWAYVERGPECWTWTGPKSATGYGRLVVLCESGYRKVPAHRLSWQITHGVAPNLFVLHHCDNPKCVRPEHLWLGTARDNVRDSVRKGRWPRGTGSRFGSGMPLGGHHSEDTKRRMSTTQLRRHEERRARSAVDARGYVERPRPVVS